MLESLSVRNYVLIDSLDITFRDGFTVLTGETGAGKSIMLGAISLLLGARADRAAIRKGAESAEISGIFRTERPAVLLWLDGKGIMDDDGTIIIRRVIRESGRSVYTVNGTPVTRNEGHELGSLLVDISSQHGEQSLLRPESLLSLLDEVSGSDIPGYRMRYMKAKEAEKRLHEIEDLVRRGEAESDFMRFALNELDAASLREGEEDELRSRIKLMNASEFIRSSLSSAIEELRNASSSLSGTLSTLRKAERKDDGLISLSERVENLDIECSDVLLTLRERLSDIDFSDADLEEANERLSTIQRVRKKYGGTVEEALRRREEYRSKLRIADDGERMLEAAERELCEAEDALLSEARALSERRKRGAKGLSRSVEERLHKLGMEKAVFTIEVERRDSPGPDGMDSVRFLIAPNRGEKLSPVQNTASGGELSRLLLAIKSVTKGGGDIETLLFDEIDAGIGGAVASSVAEEIKALSSGTQIIAITHLPQLAVRAGSHFLVSKEECGGRTISRIREITGEERVEETARLLSGETSAISLDHARSLLEVQ